MKNAQFYQQFLINREQRFIYCYVPKVACSSLKLWFLRVAGVDVQDAVPDVHAYLDRTFSLAAVPEQEAERLLHDSNYYRFAFIRNPFARLVSAYQDKIIQGNTPGPCAIKAVQRGRPWQVRKRLGYEWLKWKTGSGIDLQRGMTLREFLQFISNQPAAKLDPHWRPQPLILGDVRMDYVGLIENMSSDFEFVCHQLGLENDLQVANRARRRTDGGISENCADWTTTQLRELDRYPPYEQFFTPELREVFLSVYEKDLTVYEQLAAERGCLDTESRYMAKAS